MKTWQKYWIYGVIIFFLLHLIRDIMQDLGIHNLLSDILVKKDLSNAPTWYWKIFNTYMFEISGIIFAGYALKRGYFGKAGYWTIFIALFFLTVWLIYWVFL